MPPNDAQADRAQAERAADLERALAEAVRAPRPTTERLSTIMDRVVQRAEWRQAYEAAEPGADAQRRAAIRREVNNRYPRRNREFEGRLDDLMVNHPLDPDRLRTITNRIVEREHASAANRVETSFRDLARGLTPDQLQRMVDSVIARADWRETRESPILLDGSRDAQPPISDERRAQIRQEAAARFPLRRGTSRIESQFENLIFENHIDVEQLRALRGRLVGRAPAGNSPPPLYTDADADRYRASTHQEREQMRRGPVGAGQEGGRPNAETPVPAAGRIDRGLRGPQDQAFGRAPASNAQPPGYLNAPSADSRPNAEAPAPVREPAEGSLGEMLARTARRYRAAADEPLQAIFDRVIERNGSRAEREASDPGARQGRQISRERRDNIRSDVERAHPVRDHQLERALDDLVYQNAMSSEALREAASQIVEHERNHTAARLRDSLRDARLNLPREEFNDIVGGYISRADADLSRTSGVPLSAATTATAAAAAARRRERQRRLEDTSDRSPDEISDVEPTEPLKRRIPTRDRDPDNPQNTGPRIRHLGAGLQEGARPREPASADSGVSERPMAVPRSRLPTASAPRQEGPAGSRASADDAAAARGYGPHDGLQR